MASVEQAFYKYINDNFTSTDNGVFYNLNDDKAEAPYIVIDLADDTGEESFFCSSDEGQARFLLSVFSKPGKLTEGTDLRDDLRLFVKSMRGISNDGYKFWNIQIENKGDRAGTVDSLTQLFFEAVVSWEK